MKKLVLICGLLSASALGLQAATCSAQMTLATLTGLGGTGCDFNGYNFNNFQLSNYIDANFGGSGQYNAIPPPLGTGSIANLANYLADFTTLNGAGVTITFSGAVVQGDGEAAWTIKTGGVGSDSANFGFEIKYNIGSGTDGNAANNRDANALKTLSATLGGVTYTGAPGGDASAAFIKGVAIDGSVQVINDKLNATSGSETKFLNLVPNATGSIAVTDNLILQISNTSNALLTATSLANGFDPSAAPEPMTIGLMGIGLAGLALVRRRIQS
jgi:hypothetical protein